MRAAKDIYLACWVFFPPLASQPSKDSELAPV